MCAVFNDRNCRNQILHCNSAYRRSLLRRSSATPLLCQHQYFFLSLFCFLGFVPRTRSLPQWRLSEINWRAMRQGHLVKPQYILNNARYRTEIKIVLKYMSYGNNNNNLYNNYVHTVLLKKNCEVYIYSIIPISLPVQYKL